MDAQSQVVEGNAAPRIFFDPYYTTADGIPVVGTGARGFHLLALASDLTDELIVRLVAGPRHGALSLNYDGSFVYTPAEGFVGVDTIRYEVFDGLQSATALASIDVVPSSDALVERRLREIGQAMIAYESSFSRFPVGDNPDYFDSEGNPLISWRVHLLPYLGMRDSYDQFRLDEPWDSAHNLPLLAEMPDVFRSPGDAADSVLTRMQTFTGPDAPFGNREPGLNQRGPRFSQFPDGLSNTLLVAQSGADVAVPWTQPTDMAFDVADPRAALGTLTASTVKAMRADGAPIEFSATIDPTLLKALVTPAGGELIDAETLRRAQLELSGDAAALADFFREQETGNLKDLALAAFNHEAVQGRFPVVGASNFDADGNPFLSWRVHLLPYLGQRNLYEQFRLDEPWDSPHNLPLAAQMPDVFRSAGDLSTSTTTRMMTFTGPDAPFSRRAPGVTQLGPRYGDLIDGTSNTILYVEAAPDRAVTWTKPEDLPFDRADPLAGIDLTDEQIRAVFFDGVTREFSTTIDPASFSALVTLGGREPIDAASIEAREGVTDLRLKSQNLRTREIKNLALAIHNYESSFRRFPEDRTASDGTRLLSWRVALLPFIEHDGLFRQFRLDEPWDSPHNLALLPLMPDIFRSSGDATDSVTTRVMHFEGADAPFPGIEESDPRGPQFSQITDGTSRTLMLIEAGPEAATPWTKPGDLPLDDNNPFSPLGDLGEEIIAAFFDGRVEVLSSQISPSELRARITHNSGEDLDAPPDIGVQPGITVLQSAGDTVTNEFGVDVFHVVLDRAPAGDVVLDLSTSDNLIAIVDPPQLTFTPENWNKPQAVALRGVDNQLASSDRQAQVTVSVVDGLSATDYRTVPDEEFAALIRDDDPAPPLLTGDYNRDGVVDSIDYAVWREGLGLTDRQPYRTADGNGDSRIDSGDLDLWKQNYGSQAPAAQSPSGLTGGGSAAATQVDWNALALAHAEVSTLGPQQKSGFVEESTVSDQTAQLEIGAALALLLAPERDATQSEAAEPEWSIGPESPSHDSAAGRYGKNLSQGLRVLGGVFDF